MSTFKIGDRVNVVGQGITGTVVYDGSGDDFIVIEDGWTPIKNSRIEFRASDLELISDGTFIEYYTRVGAYDTWAIHTVEPKDFGEDVLYYVMNGYHVKIDKQEITDDIQEAFDEYEAQRIDDASWRA